MLSVLRDYISYRERGTTLKEAINHCGKDDVESWFYSQYGWRDVENQGKQVKDPTPQQILDALDRVRGGENVGNDTTVKEDLRQKSKLIKRELQAKADRFQNNQNLTAGSNRKLKM